MVFGPGENGNVSRLIKSQKIFIFIENKYPKKSGIYMI